MSGCKPNCASGCCGDFSSRAPRSPNLLAIDVMGGLLEQAVRNMSVRAAELETGMMTEEDYEAAREKLVRWLIALLSGENPHFESDPEWHQGGGLVDYLRQRLDLGTLGARAVLEHAVRLFSEDADQIARDYVRSGGAPESEAARSELATLWAQLFTGAPEAF